MSAGRDAAGDDRAARRPEDPSRGDAGRAGPGRLPRGGLCPSCRHVTRVTSARSTFLRCGRQRTDPRYPKYPPQPVLSCPGFEE